MIKSNLMVGLLSCGLLLPSFSFTASATGSLDLNIITEESGFESSYLLTDSFEHPNRDSFTSKENFEERAIAYVSTWQDFVFAVNTPTIEWIELQNNIVLPDNIELIPISRDIQIIGQGYELNLGTNQLNFTQGTSIFGTYCAFIDITIRGRADVLITNPRESHVIGDDHFEFIDVSVHLDGAVDDTPQTLIQGPQVHVYIAGKSAFVNEAPDITGKIMSGVTLNFEGSNTSIFDLALYDFEETSNLCIQAGRVLIMNSQLNVYLSEQMSLPLINNAYHIRFSGSSMEVQSESELPLFNFNTDEYFINMDEYFTPSIGFFHDFATNDINISLNNVAAIAVYDSDLIIDTWYHDFLDSEINLTSQRTEPIQTTGQLNFSISGNEDMTIQNLSGGKLFAASDTHITLGSEQNLSNLYLWTQDNLVLPPVHFSNIHAVIDGPNGTNVCSTNNPEFARFVEGQGGLANFSRLSTSAQ